MKKSGFTETEIMSVLKQAEAGMAVVELGRQHGYRMPHFTNGGQNMVVWTLR